MVLLDQSPQDVSNTPHRPGRHRLKLDMAPPDQSFSGEFPPGQELDLAEGLGIVDRHNITIFLNQPFILPLGFPVSLDHLRQKPALALKKVVEGLCDIEESRSSLHYTPHRIEAERVEEGNV